MAAPVRDCIELQTVGELHLVLCCQPLSLLLPLVPASMFAISNVLVRIFAKFVCVSRGRVSGRRTPSSPTKACRALIVAVAGWCSYRTGCGGGIPCERVDGNGEDVRKRWAYRRGEETSAVAWFEAFHQVTPTRMC